MNTILFCTLNFHPRSLYLVHNKLHATLMGFQTHCMTQETCVHLACHMRDMSKMFSYYLILYMCSQCAISLVQHFTCQNVTSTRKFHTIQTNKILTCVKFPKKMIIYCWTHAIQSCINVYNINVEIVYGLPSSIQTSNIISHPKPPTTLSRVVYTTSACSHGVVGHGSFIWFYFNGKCLNKCYPQPQHTLLHYQPTTPHG